MSLHHLFNDSVDFTELKNYTDWRLPENRLEAFTRVYHTRIDQGDLDHHHSGKVISKEKEYTLDQQALYCLLFGQSYRNHVAFLVLEEFPNLLDVNQKNIEDWHDDNWKRLLFAKDTKWGLRKLPAFIESIKKQVGDSSPYEFYKKASSVGTTKENYFSLNETIRSLFGIGRMTGWLAQQTFFEFFDFDVNHLDMQLYDDTWSQYDSLCYLFNRMDLAYKKKKTKEEIELMEKNFQVLMEFMTKRLTITPDVYNVESCLCEYRKTAAPRKKPKEFTFWASTEMAIQYKQLKESWPEIDWSPYLISIMTKGEHARKYFFSEEFFNVVIDTGMNFNTHILYDEPNAFDVLGLPATTLPEVSYMLSDWEKVKNKEQLIEKYNPRNFVK